MTELLYYQDTGILEFNSVISAAGADDSGFYLLLEKTAFYPEGGGQPADRGAINGITVADVQKKDGEIRHYLSLSADNTALPAAGETAECIIDGEHRMEYMQQHTGQHLLSAAMMNTSGIETVSVRQGADYTAIESSSEEIDAETIKLIEDEANSYIRRNVEIKAHRTDAEGLKNFSLRRPSKHSTNIRIIEIPGIDCVACGGMHLKTTAETGLVKYIYQEKIRGHVRTFWKIGKRAYDDYAEKTEVINRLIDFYSAKQHELPEKAAAAGAALVDERYHHSRLEQEYAELFAENITASAQGAVTRVFENKSKGFVTALLKSLSLLEYPSPVFIFNKTENALTWSVAAPSRLQF